MRVARCWGVQVGVVVLVGCLGGGRKAGADWLPHVRVWLVWVGGDVAKRLERVF